MKGVILAGGLGTRLRPLTLVTNKHLLPVYDRPMVYYPIQSLVGAGIRDLLVVTGGEHAGDFLKVLKDGQHLGVRRLEYAYQAGEGGIADALKLAEGFCDGDKLCVLLGDNILQGSIAGAAQRFESQPAGARVLLKEVPDPHRFGIATVDPARGRVSRIVEKPASPDGNQAVVGVYFFDAAVFEICRELKPSARGELEISDVLSEYIARGELEHEVLEGWWTDAGTFEGLGMAAQLVATTGIGVPAAVPPDGAPAPGGARASRLRPFQPSDAPR